MKLSFVVAIFSSAFLLTACSSTKDMNQSIKIDEKPKYQIPAKVEPPKPQAKGSLFSGRSNSLFSDRKELQLGDIVFIKIEEDRGEITTKSEKTSSLNDEARSQTGGSLDNFPTTSLNGVGSILEKSVSALNKVLGIGYTLPSRSGSFSANTESTTELEFKDNISAVITEQYQNGNYLIEGLKQIVVNGQKHTLKITGVLNPRELEGTTIDSEKLANLKVIYFKDGDEQDYMEKPWGTKVLETISPF